jgi:predicted PurR-regulated permease PerM
LSGTTLADLSAIAPTEAMGSANDTLLSRPSPNQQIEIACLLTLTFVAVGGALYFLRPVVVPFILAAFFYYLLSPMITLLSRRLRVPRPVAIVLAGIIGLVGLTVAGLVIGQNAIEIGKQAPIYRQGIEDLATKASKYSWAAKLGLRDKLANGQLLQLPEQATNSFLSSVASERSPCASNSAPSSASGAFALSVRRGRSEKSRTSWRAIPSRSWRSRKRR